MVDVTGDCGPMILEACKRGNKSFLQKILDDNKNAGIKPNLNVRDGLGNTPLHYSAQGQHLDTLLILLQSNADPNIKNQVGDTALHKAVGKNSEEIIRSLCEAGADANIKNNKNLSSMHMARTQGIKDLIKKIASRQKEVEDCDDDDMFASDDDSE